MTGCVEPDDPQPTGELYFLELSNNSSHNIKIDRFRSHGEKKNPYFLKATADTVISHSYDDEPISLFYVFGVSAEVIYDDDISIFHTRELEQDASRSLFLPSSYEGGKVTDVQYIFSYEFTDADYDEAVELGG
jgi:hypothetical protein